MGILALLVILNIDIKGIWIPRWSITDRNKIFTCLDEKFNYIFLQVFAAGEAYYPSKYAPSKIKSDQWLKDFLAEAHRRNIKVAAWINIFYSWGYAPRTFSVLHPINCHPNWYVQDQFQRSILDYRADELKKIGIEGYYLAPAHPDVRRYMAKIIEEILSYDFDGIHLDYIRYPNSAFVYDPALRSKFMREYYLDPIDIAINRDTLQMKLGLWGYDDLRNRWQEFINNDLTAFIGDLNKSVKKIRPDIEISVAVKPDYLAAQKNFYQTWMHWLNAGFVDFVCLMSYGKNLKTILDKTLKGVNDKKRVMIGLGLYLLSPYEIEKQVHLVEGLDFGGIVYFSYEELKHNRAYLNSLKAQ